VSIGRI